MVLRVGFRSDADDGEDKPAEAPNTTECQARDLSHAWRHAKEARMTQPTLIRFILSVLLQSYASKPMPPNWEINCHKFIDGLDALSTLDS